MIPLSQPAKVTERKGNIAMFEIEALYPGYGVTVGNSLRRVLLSSLEGAAVTKVKIKGATHEFTTIPGMHEDMIMLLLNIKQLRFKLHGEEPQSATLKTKGEKAVTGALFDLPSQLELANKDLVIAHLTAKNAELEMEIRVEKGIGYVQAEMLKKEKEEIGTITLDAIFTPVKKVSFQVEKMRVGERTDFDKVRLSVETDGTITPEQAFSQAADILVRQFSVVLDGIKEIAEKQTEEEKTAAEKEEKKERKKTEKAEKTEKAKKPEKKKTEVKTKTKKK